MVGRIFAFDAWVQRLDGQARTLSGKTGFERGHGLQGLLTNHTEEAVRRLPDATTLEPESPELGVDLAIAYKRGRHFRHNGRLQEAPRLKPDHPR
jgi:hypothetical protein